ncbi:hypothetical protein HQ585_11560 [candidate division KSB1 bacterium]|nr:hypothetical protein [candidate division KSB1 bacterium]
MNLYISNKILNWYFYIENASIFEEDEFSEPYNHFYHAEMRITNENEIDLIDCICALKRSVEQRLQQLNMMFKFKNILDDSKPKGLIQQLHFYGFIRPLMLLKLIEIRNLIEHRNEKPPNLDRCSELLEFVWYFLKTTDKIIKLDIRDYIFEEILNKTKYSLRFSINTEDEYNLDIIECILPTKYLSTNEVKNWLHIQGVRKITTIKKYNKEIEGTCRQPYLDAGRAKDILIFGGKIIGIKHKLEIINLAFKEISKY